jgi:hypothetical protein
MSELAATAERLRVVKDACMDFISLWAIDQLMAEDRLSERVYGDVLNTSQGVENNALSITRISRGMTD